MMRIQLGAPFTIVIIVTLLSLSEGAQSRPLTDATMGEIKGRIAQLERAGGSSYGYRGVLEAFIEGLKQGYRISAKRDPAKFFRTGGDPFCEFRKASYWLDKALATGEESFGILLSEIVWVLIREQCNISGIEPAFDRKTRWDQGVLDADGR